MRAYKGKDGLLTFINRDQVRLVNNIDMMGFLPISNLSERDAYVAEEMYKQNVLRKVKRGETIGYKTYDQKSKL